MVLSPLRGGHRIPWLNQSFWNTSRLHLVALGSYKVNYKKSIVLETCFLLILENSWIPNLVQILLAFWDKNSSSDYLFKIIIIISYNNFFDLLLCMVKRFCKSLTAFYDKFPYQALFYISSVVGYIHQGLGLCHVAVTFSCLQKAGPAEQGMIGAICPPYFCGRDRSKP